VLTQIKLRVYGVNLNENFKEMNGCDRVQLQSHINEFMWRQWHTNGRVDAFDKILEELGKLL
jgi:hypothetical protein